MKLKSLVWVVLFVSFVFGACSEYNKVSIKDKNENNETIYGEKGAPPMQMANKYESNPNSAEQVKKIRQKLYPR